MQKPNIGEMSSEAVRALAKTSPVHLTLEPDELFALVLNLQLALHHPANNTGSSKVVRDIVRKLQIIIGQRSQIGYDVIEFGWQELENCNGWEESEKVE